ncbi:hypothetical protein HPB50_011307 [Hyalomma asiaticum]|uniref:Uncharacterized protein n=1 Tax=Hyalomma asiaticum TaxID=266040 RepID=A0ACB7RTY6_HYAAI|nr:hypothetical protein HPB50_011307 [Hyalomma asiaticum]
MPFSKLKGERPNGMGNSSFDIGICVSRCTEGGRAPGFRGRILRVTGTSRVGGLQVGTLYQETPERESLPHDKPPTVSEPALEAMEVTTGTPESVTLRDSPKARRKSQDRLKQQKKHPPVMPPATGDDT